VLRERYCDDEQARARFLAEGITLTRLNHRNVVQSWEAVDARQPYLVMEVADAGSLHDWVTRYGSMPPRMAVDVAVQICKGIGVAHRSGVIHRDVKPHNVLVNRKGTCKVSDFGIALLDRRGQAPDATTHHEAMGTIGYMAPEQRGDPRAADARVDVYGIGATLYTLLTGRVVTNLFKAIEDDPATLADIPQALVPVLSKATAYRADARFATVHDLAKALHEIWSVLPEDERKVRALGSDADPEPPPPPGVEIRSPAIGYSVPPMNFAEEFAQAAPTLDDFPRSTPVPLTTPPYAPQAIRMATTAPPANLRYFTDPDDTVDAPAPRTRPWFVALAVTGILVLLSLLPVQWVRSAATSAVEAKGDFTRAVLTEQTVVDELGQLGADRKQLEALIEAYRAAPDLPGAVAAADRYLDALAAAERGYATGRTDRTVASVEARIGRMEDERDAWLAAVETWRDRTGAFPGTLGVCLGLAPAPPDP
jgi:serine/threonine protein kinase